MLQEIVDHWNGRSPTYDESPGHGISGTQEKSAWMDVLGTFLPAPPAEVLDVGCGTGFLSVLLVELGYTVTGIDLAEEMLTAARAKVANLSPTPRFISDDAAAPAWPDKSFDAIVSRHVLWTLIDPGAAVTNWLRLLRPGGRMLAFDNVKTGPRIPTVTTGYREELRASLPFGDIRSTESVVSVLQTAGFAEVSAHPMADIEQSQREAQPQKGAIRS